MKAFHASLEYVGLIWPDLRVGIAGIYDRIPAQPVAVRPALPDVSIEEFIGSAHIAYPSVPLILIIETYIMEHRHDSITGRRTVASRSSAMRSDRSCRTFEREDRFDWWPRSVPRAGSDGNSGFVRTRLKASLGYGPISATGPH